MHDVNCTCTPHLFCCGWIVVLNGNRSTKVHKPWCTMHAGMQITVRSRYTCIPRLNKFFSCCLVILYKQDLFCKPITISLWIYKPHALNMLHTVNREIFVLNSFHAIRVKIFSYASRPYENILTTKMFLQWKFRGHSPHVLTYLSAFFSSSSMLFSWASSFLWSFFCLLSSDLSSLRSVACSELLPLSSATLHKANNYSIVTKQFV